MSPPRPALVLHPGDVSDVADVGARLDEAFAAMQAAVAEDQPVVVVLHGADLLGQRTPEDAALATALLGMVRALALEGAKEGWKVNAVTHSGAEAAVDEAVAWVAGAAGLTGQLIRIGTDHLGRVWP